jgi:arylsulfotransferase ASST
VIATLLRFAVSARLKSALLVAAALAAIVAVGCNSSSSAASGVAVFPLNGTPTASPRTQISFRGESPAQLTGITVSGSSSGDHSGTLKPHSDGDGASFVPDRSFKRGETVTVKADPDLLGAKNGAVKFKIAEKAPKGVPGTVRPDPGGNPKGTQRFRSRPDLRPPSIKFTKRTSKTAPGDLFLAPKAGPGQDGTVITDASGRLIWFKRVPKLTSAFDFRVQQYEGKPVLTWWQGGVHHGQGQGKGLIYDSSYKRIATVPAGNGYEADFHEFQLSRDGKTAFLLIYEPVRYDLRLIGGPKDGSVLDGIVQEIDIKTGLVLFEWHTMGAIGLRETYANIPKDSPLDVSHVNSVYEEKDGNLLVSARDTHAALELDRKSGKVLWRLGGRSSDYKMSGGSQFVEQHDVRRTDDGRLTVFDNGAPPSPGRPARGLALKVDEDKKSVKLSRVLRRSSPIHSPSQGNVQALPNGNFLVGWGGDVPNFSEFTSSGKLALDGKIVPETLDTYRVWRLPWSAKPSRPPDVAAQTGGGQTGVYASWNGATDVKQWQVLTGDNPNVLLPGKKVDRSGFETKIVVSGAPAYVAVRALDANGLELGTSKPVKPRA